MSNCGSGEGVPVQSGLVGDCWSIIIGLCRFGVLSGVFVGEKLCCSAIGLSRFGVRSDVGENRVRVDGGVAKTLDVLSLYVLDAGFASRGGDVVVVTLRKMVTKR